MKTGKRWVVALTAVLVLVGGMAVMAAPSVSLLPYPSKIPPRSQAREFQTENSDEKLRDLEEAFERFVNQPSAKKYLEVRRLLVASEEYNPYSTEMRQIEALLRSQQPGEASKAIRRSMPNLLLSPRAHIMAFLAARQHGDSAGMAVEKKIVESLFQGLLETGDGSRQRPFLVLRVSDEYDLLSRLEKKAVSNSLQSIEDRYYDVIECRDGSRVWFDITDPYNWLQRQMKGTHVSPSDDETLAPVVEEETR